MVFGAVYKVNGAEISESEVKLGLLLLITALFFLVFPLIEMFFFD
jgi:hypothetical protein